MGEWVIDTALQQLSQWHAAGLKISVSVNITAYQLQQSDFLARLTALLDAHPDIHPSHLELELLETSALEDITSVSRIMHTVRELGVRFALDDFGTGYSSLTYLKRLPADVLKIDQSFVSDMFDNPNDLAIVEGVVGLAAAFHRDVIAEGVETVVHGQLLLSLGCELAQGYGIAWPMPAAEFPAWASSWRPDESWSAWLDHPYSREEVSIIHAEVEHRHWIYNIEAYLNGKLDTPPPMSIHDCHFGVWLETEGRTRYRDHPYFSVVLDLHERVHAMGHELVDLYVHGQNPLARSRLKRLYNLRDELISKLRMLANMTEQNI
jgi:EAL domain-containing protein (putative c-di-GMP-specific phosphodiesterase class I)